MKRSKKYRLKRKMALAMHIIPEGNKASGIFLWHYPKKNSLPTFKYVADCKRKTTGNSGIFPEFS
jgi:hypothetical protein